jgi:tRNA dimethylallyltransferase
MGPTASGKTDLAVELVQLFPLDIVSVDSALVYRGMDIGTAKPDKALLRQAPHRLIDICDPAEPYSAARFREDALREMAAISAAGRIPLLVGGTMLYFRALESGLAALPAADPEVRQALAEELEAHGLAALHARLSGVDPASAARIHPNDPQRILRALEVFQLTGRPLSHWHRSGTAADFPYRLLKLVLGTADREQLRERIARRFHAMLAAGLEDEVRALLEREGLSPDLPSMRAVGYRQVAEYLRGGSDRDAMISKAIDATRQLAKRQMTWLRREQDALWLHSGDQGLRRAREAIAGFLAGT